jgi:bifunctional DNA-binding transcriptional regulator/antitoxin component of YhaV-PrlF toxin-antitoxin module
MDTAQVSSKGQLVVPVRLRRKYGIKPGVKIRFIDPAFREVEKEIQIVWL